jgi:hypothetical protein
MHIPLQYIYFFGSIVASLPWLVVFFFRKDLQREMLVMGLLFMVPAVIAEYFIWTVDYWRPITLEGTRIGFEDILLGFTNGGLIAICYEFFLGKKHLLLEKKNTNVSALLIFLLLVFVLTLLFWGFHVNSSIATPISFLVAVTALLLLRRDLIVYSLVSGTITMIGSIPVYIILEYLSPKFVNKTWLIGNLTGITIAGIPIEDLIYYFTLGCLLGTFYLFWKNEGLNPHSTVWHETFKNIVDRQ